MMVLGQYMAVLAGIWRYWVSMGQHWLVLGGTRSIEGCTGTRWYWVSMGRYLLVLGGTGSAEGGNG